MEILYSSTHLNVISSILCLFLLHQCYDVNAKIPMPYPPIDSVAIDCGAYGNSSAPDGRTWIGDIGSKLSELQHNGKRSVALKSSFQGSDISNPPIPYKTARISLSQFSYKFEVNPGQKFIRLHFFPASYPGFERSNALFTVKAGPYTLLSNFSPSLTADYMASQYLVKEFCLNIKEANQELTISFFPSPAAYAFINGVEIVSMPAGLYYTHKTDPGAVVVGQDHRFYIGNSTAMETVQRLNIGGSSVTPTQDPGMYRSWSQDSKYLTAGSGVSPIITTIPVAYTSIPAYAAPQPVYQSVWSSTASIKRENQMMINFTWKLPVDLGFRYLVRLHFCEFEYGIKETGQREFSILINQQIAEACADVMEWSGGNGVAVYKDYVVMMEGDRMQGKCDLILALQSHKAIDPILNGLEVFKLSNPDNNLAGLNPEPQLTVVAKSLKVLKLQKLSSSAIINRLIIFITIVNIAVHCLCILAESYGKKNISKLSSPKATCRRFSMLEMQTATNNFEDSLIIGSGGFGKVYKGIIDQGATVVAIKRLNPESRQGAREFWTEIDMLSELRHNNLLTLLGYCNENAEMILVYEYMAQGTLADHLYNKNRRNEVGGIPGRLNWEQRLNICIGAARGLNILHTAYPRIIHRDVKSTNILLDQSWVAKISDFGLSKMVISNQSRSYISTEVKGTFGYLDPEYYQTKRLTRKSDVYAFGVVLLEVLCGRRPVDLDLEEEQHSLALWAKHCIREGKVDQIVDPYLGTQISPGCLKLFAELAEVCLCEYPKNRPAMNDVLGMLELSLESQRSSSSSFIQEDAVDTGETKHSSDLHLQQDSTLPSRKQSKYTVSNVVKTMTLILKGKDQNRQREKRRRSSSGSSLWSWSSRWPKAFRSRTNKMATILPDYCFGDIHRFSLYDLIVATDNFSNRNILGRGGFGKVYKGYLRDGSLVAVKRLKEERTQGGELQFQTKVEFLDRAVHRNLLRLRGYCMTPSERILVYPFMANGSVASCLRERGDSQPPLVWPIRKQIALDVATGLVYLHEHCDPKIIHRDLKAENVLLDEDFRAVVGDFGLVKLVDYKDSHVTTAIRGTIGHIAPEYLSTGRASMKTDVFGYGVMLLELITGQRAFDLARLANDDEVMLLDWVKVLLKEKKLKPLVDKDMKGDYIDEEVEQLIQVALLCTQGSPNERPTMSDVVRMLQGDGLVERWEEWQFDELFRHRHHQHPHNERWPKAFRSRTNKRVTILPHYCFGDINRYSLDELIVATDNFSNRNILGRGGFGKVYKGYLRDGSLVAVKRLKEERIGGGELEFQTEVEFLDRAVHRNLLRLRGYCMIPSERILVYPFMANGSVASCLRERWETQPPLDWPIRKQIALDVATALVYLHEHCDPKIIHRDLKAENVLLDDDFRAVVCDFGLAKLVDYKDSHVTTAVRGTLGHTAPEYFSTGKASIKTDVFGYSVMLLELITGQRAFDLARLANDDEVMLLDWIKKSMTEGRTFFIVDEDLRGNYVLEELEKLLQVALICTQCSPSSRPHMSEVVRMLQDDEMWKAKYDGKRNNCLPDSTPCLAQDDGSSSSSYHSCQFQFYDGSSSSSYHSCQFQF